MHSHILTKPPFLPHVVDLLVLSTYIFARLPCQVRRRRFLRARLCTVYYRDSVETIKNGRAWRFFFFSFTMHHPPAPFSTGGSPSARRLCRMDGKGKRFFSPVSVLQTSLRQINGSESPFHLPFLPHQRSSFPDFAALLDFLALKATIIPVLQGWPQS